MLGLVSLLGIFGFATPWLGALALGFDLLILGLVAWDGRQAHRTPLTVRRRLPRVLHQAEPATVGLLFRNDAARPVRLRVREVLSPHLVDEPRDLVLVLPPRSRAARPLPLVPRLRGQAVLAPMTVRVQGPWGLAWSQRSVAPGDSLRIFPRSRFDGRTGLMFRHAIERRTGANPVQRRGFGAELYALREYLPGDQLRNIHWKASARLRRPVTREDTWEQHQHVVLLVDCGRPMAALAETSAVPMSKLDHALGMVLALLRVIVAQNDSATLVLFSKELRCVVRVDRRTRSFAPTFEAVHEVQADLDEPDYAAVASWAARKVPRQSLALVCTSVIDMNGAELLGQALAGLARRHRPLLVNLEDPGLVHHAESIPDDVEGAFAKTSAMAMVQANLALTRRLGRHGVDVVSAPASQLPLQLLQRYLDLKARRRA